MGYAGYICGLLLVIASAIRIVFAANSLPFFWDEMCVTTAAYSFFHSLNYMSAFSTDHFDPAATTGIAGTWPGALYWLTEGNLFGQRVATGVVWWSGFSFIGWRYFRGEGLSKSNSFFLTAVAWSFILLYPYWYGFLYSLGELPGMFYLSLGLFCLNSRPKLAAVLWGISVWHVKVIFLPIPLAWLFVYAWIKGANNSEKLTTLLRQCFYFVLPMVFWMALIALRFGLQDLGQWLQILWGVIDANALSSKTNMPLPKTLLEGTAMKLNFYGPIIISYFIYLFYLWKTRKQKSPMTLERGLLHISALTFFVYTVWFFGFHEQKWPRHFQPALYLGFGLSVYIYVQLFRDFLQSFLARSLSLSFVSCILASLLILSNKVKLDLKFEKPSYAFLCVDLYSKACLDETGNE